MFRTESFFDNSLIMNMESKNLCKESSFILNMASKKLNSVYISYLLKFEFKVQESFFIHEFFFNHVFTLIFSALLSVCFILLLEVSLLLIFFFSIKYTFFELAYLNYSLTVYLPKPYSHVILELLMRCLKVHFLIIHYGC